MTAQLLHFPSRNIGKSQRIKVIIEACIARNQSITIGTSYPKQRLAELQSEFPNAKFEICGQGIKLCQK